jgi:hypothetical protein
MKGPHRALIPRVIGETERAQAEKAAHTALPPIERNVWIGTKLRPCGSDVVAAGKVSAVFRRLPRSRDKWRGASLIPPAGFPATRN